MKSSFEKVQEDVETLYNIDVPERNWDVASAMIELSIQTHGWTPDEYWAQVMTQEQVNEDQS